MIRPLGDRALVRPVEQAPVGLIIQANPDPPVVGEILAVGTARCRECGAPLTASLTPGMRVALRPGLLVHEVTDPASGERWWIVEVGEVIGEVEPSHV